MGTMIQESLWKRMCTFVVASGITIGMLSFVVFGQGTGASSRLMAPSMSNEATGTDIESKLDFLPDVVARTNKIEVKAEKLKKVLLPRLKQLAEKGRVPPRRQIRQVARRVADQLLNQEIVMQLSQQAGFEPDMEKAKKKLNNMENRVGNNKFAALLKKQGRSRQSVTEEAAEQLAINQWIKERLSANISVTEEKLKKFYKNNKKKFKVPERVEVSHILFRVEPGSEEGKKKTKREKARQVLEKIKNSDVDFGEMARKHSDGPSAEKGGELPPFSRDQMVPSFENVAFSLNAGQISDVVQTPFGFHIIKCRSKSVANMPSFEEAKEKAEKLYKKQKAMNRLQNMVQQVRKKTEAEVSIPRKQSGGSSDED